MAVRFGLGHWDGLCSSTWKVWPGADGSVYVADRKIGHIAKVSLHPRDPANLGGEWRIAFNSKEIAQRVSAVSPSGRVIDAWSSEENRLPAASLRTAFAVVLGRPSLGYTPLPTDSAARQQLRRLRARGVDLSAPMPDLDHLWQFTVLIGDPGAKVHAPGTRAMGAVPVGSFNLPTQEQVWVMRHLIPYPDALKEQVAQMVTRALANAGDHPCAPTVRTVHLQGQEPDGLRWILAVAVTYGPIPTELAEF